MNPLVRIVAAVGRFNMGQRDRMRLLNQVPPAGVNRRKDIPFINDGDPMHLLDVYMPMGKKEKRPVILDVHGGGWVYGSKEVNRNFCRWLASQRFTVICPNYRLVPRTDLKGQLADVLAAMRWIVENGNEYYCDPAHTFLTGDSAGAHLISVATCINESSELQALFGLAPSGLNVRALALNHGVFDRDEAVRYGGFIAKEVSEAMLGGDTGEAIWVRKASFPSAAEGIKVPPILIISGELDLSYTVHSLKLAADLEEMGIPYDMLYWKKKDGPKLGHVFNVHYPEWEQSVKTNETMLDFFRANDTPANK